MSTIDIGIAETPAHPNTRPAAPAVARPAIARQPQSTLEPIHVDFYVGSTKIEALPPVNR